MHTSPKFTWKLLEGPIWNILVKTGNPLHFHTNLEACTLEVQAARCLAGGPSEVHIDPEITSYPGARM